MASPCSWPNGNPSIQMEFEMLYTPAVDVREGKSRACKATNDGLSGPANQCGLVNPNPEDTKLRIQRKTELSFFHPQSILERKITAPVRQ